MSSMNVVPPPVGLVKVNDSGNQIMATSNNNSQLSQLVKMLGGKKLQQKIQKTKKKRKNALRKKYRMKTHKRQKKKKNKSILNLNNNSKSQFTSFSSSFVSSSVRTNKNKPKNEIKYVSNVEWMPWKELTNNQQKFTKPHIMSTAWDYKGSNLKSLSKRHLNQMKKWTKQMKKIKPLSSSDSIPISYVSSSFMLPASSWKFSQPSFFGGNTNGNNGIEVATVPVPYQETTPKGSDLASITSNLASTINQSHANAVFDNAAK